MPATAAKAADSQPATDGLASAGSPASPLFGWFYCRSKYEPDHIIALCAGHSYLAGSGWKSGSGDMPDLPPADKCCVCMGTATIRQMISAPLKPNDQAQTQQGQARPINEAKDI
ncbi:MAG: hypothetical protein ACOYMN_12835 [Roseimicrobium sp.]